VAYQVQVESEECRAIVSEHFAAGFETCSTKLERSQHLPLRQATERIIRRFAQFSMPVPDILLSADTVSRPWALSADTRDHAVVVLM
jgi:hypothetical protein